MKIESTTTGRFLAAIVTAAVLAVPVAAGAQTQRGGMQSQGAVTSSDIQRLQDELFQASSDISRDRSSDPAMQDELDELREEVIYLKVRLRKDGRVNRNDYVDVRNRIQTLRSRTRGGAVSDRNDRNDRTDAERRGAWTGGTGSTGGVSGGTQGGVSGGTQQDRSTSDYPRSQQGNSAIPEGQEIDVRLQTRLSSDDAQVEDRFQAETLVDLYRGNDVLIPAGSVLRGVVRTVQRASRTDRKGEMTVSFDQITVRGRTYPMRGTVSQAIESDGVKGEAARIGAGASVGAIIGGIVGGVKGALLGVLIGGGGTIAATEGKDVTLEPGTILRVRLDTPPAVR